MHAAGSNASTISRHGELGPGGRMTILAPAALRAPVMRTVDELLVESSPHRMFELASAVEEWPRHLRHYRYVRMHERDGRGGGRDARSKPARRSLGGSVRRKAMHWYC